MSNTNLINKAKEKAYKLMFEDHKFVDGLAILLELIETEEVDWNVYYLLGQGFRFINDFEDSIKFLSKAIDLNSDDAPVFHALGIAYQLNGDYSVAIDQFKEALNLDPTYSFSINSIGLTYRKMGEFDNAMQYYSKAQNLIISNIHKQICDPESLCYKDEIIDGKKTMSVLPYYFIKTEEILKSNPEYAIVTNNIGACFSELGDIEAAREKFQESVEMTPSGYNYPDPVNALKDIDD
jgi:tetratricopeptide (TPR) repeat protein